MWYAWFKAKTGRRYLWARNTFSSIQAIALDSMLFITIAFYGAMPIVPMDIKSRVLSTIAVGMV